MVNSDGHKKSKVSKSKNIYAQAWVGVATGFVMRYSFYYCTSLQGNLNGLKPKMMLLLLTNTYGILPQILLMVSNEIHPLQGLLPWLSKQMLLREDELLTTSEQVHFPPHKLTKLGKVKFPFQGRLLMLRLEAQGQMIQKMKVSGCCPDMERRIMIVILVHMMLHKLFLTYLEDVLEYVLHSNGQTR